MVAELSAATVLVLLATMLAVAAAAVVEALHQVIDELCKLVRANSYDNYRFCMMPTESLILSVIQSLLNVRRTNEMRLCSFGWFRLVLDGFCERK